MNSSDGSYSNLRESSVNVISRFNVCVNHEWQFTRFFVIFSEKVENCCVISYEIAKITEIWREQDFAV